MSHSWRKYSPEFRRDVLERMKSCDNVSALSRELGIRRQMLYQWRDQAAAAARPVAGRPVIAPGEDDADGAAEVAALRRKVQQLESLVLLR
jgi:transposase-like protein